MILYHYSKEPFVLDYERQYPQPQYYYAKPTGLWLSDCTSYGWKEFCESSKWNLDHLAHVTKFECDLFGWLVIDNYEQMQRFYKQFSMPMDVRRAVATAKALSRQEEQEDMNYLNVIDWHTVKKIYKNILITPYLAGARNKYLWYYGWDCASACVWNVSSIKAVE